MMVELFSLVSRKVGFIEWKGKVGYDLYDSNRSIDKGYINYLKMGLVVVMCQLMDLDGLSIK